jgi:hypothetical protein
MEPKIITELSAAADGNYNDLPDLLRRTMAAYNAIASELAAEKMQHSVTIAEEHESRTAFQERLRELEAELVDERKRSDGYAAIAGRQFKSLQDAGLDPTPLETKGEQG